ncbi:MAG: hypothetical protein HOO95_07655 [Gallionella sp.]|nr:hypothetical protein [Gallionella sp.]
MMTFILIASFFLIAFVGLLRYDVHKHKYAQPKKGDATSPSDSPDTNQETHGDKDK